MQCGINPKGSFIFSCPSMCHRLLVPLFIWVSITIQIPTSQVCLKPNPSFILLHHFSSVTVVQAIDSSFCIFSLSNVSSHLLSGITALQIILSVMLLVLPVISTSKESVAMYKATQKWQPNHYIQLFVKDGILYFVVYVSLSTFSFITIMFSHPSFSQLPTKN